MAVVIHIRIAYKCFTMSLFVIRSVFRMAAPSYQGSSTLEIENALQMLQVNHHIHMQRFAPKDNLHLTLAKSTPSPLFKVFLLSDSLMST